MAELSLYSLEQNKLNKTQTAVASEKIINSSGTFTIKKSVPSDAKFTDTVYTHPSSHPASMITQSSSARFVTDAEKAEWSAKWDYSEDTIKSVKVNSAKNADTVNGKTVAVNVPANAKFTDTVYTHPSSHPASMITGLHASATTGVAGSVAWGNVTGKPSLLSLGTSSSTAYRGDRGLIAYNHSQSAHVPTGRTITAGNGLTGGGTLESNRTITLATPGALTNATTNEVTTSSHTHSLPNRTSGSSSAGYVTYSGTTRTTGTFYGGTTAPTGTTRLNYDGYLYATRSYNAVYNDYAEYFLKDEQEIEAGDIIIKNPDGHGFIKSQKAKSNLVVGVMSTDYAQCIGGDRDVSVEEQEEKYAPVGMAGRVPVKVTGRIELGDLIVSSHIPGVGMASKEYTPGTVVGKALEVHDSDEVGKIEMLIMNM